MTDDETEKKRRRQDAVQLWCAMTTWGLALFDEAEERRKAYRREQDRPPYASPLEALKAYRLEMGWSEEQMALLLKMPVEFVQGVEAGEISLRDHPLVAGQYIFLTFPRDLIMGLVRGEDAADGKEDER